MVILLQQSTGTQYYTVRTQATVMANVKGGEMYRGMVTVAGGGGMCFEEGRGQIDK